VVAPAAATDVARPGPGEPDGPGPGADGPSAMPIRRNPRRRPSVEPVMGDDVDELVTAAKAGDRGAFDALVRATYVDTYTLAHRLTGDDEDARDVTQETYLRAFRGLRRFRGDAQFTTWLYRITANCASTHLGRRARHRHEELHDDLPVDDVRPGHDPVGRAEHAALRERVHVALRGLPPRLRAVIVLRDIYDLPHEAIAAELGISESAAKVRLHRARRKLRDDVFLRDADGEEAARAV
jgi:RNA polymerase sigma-70 factor, ECF subfamily